jgi:hypothetical protein
MLHLLGRTDEGLIGEQFGRIFADGFDAFFK